MDYGSQLTIFLDVVIATFLTAFVGFEREHSSKPAGVRTNMIVGGSTCLIVSLTIPLVDYIEAQNITEIINTDPIRVLEALVLGVSFIGAGTILKSFHDKRVIGLTTAATLLYSCGIGICIALKQYLLGVCITALILIINYVFDRVLNKLWKTRKKKNTENT